MDLGLSMAEAAKILGVSRPSLRGWEAGTKRPEAKRRGKVLEFLGYDPDEGSIGLGERLQRAQQARGLTQKELCALLGLDPKTVRRFEAHGNSRIRRSAEVCRRFVEEAEEAGS